MDDRSFGALILTHGRPDRVYTYDALRRHGYTGPIRLVIDDEDKAGAAYRERFKGEVRVFSKDDIAARFDEADNFGDRRSVFYARNAAFDIAEAEGFTHFIQLDDDYTEFCHRYNSGRQYGRWVARDLDATFAAMVEFLDASGALSVCMSQGGDHCMGPYYGFGRKIYATRKAMNTFVCATARRFAFQGRVNEDVNTYTSAARAGGLFLTLGAMQVQQKQTQANPGGMTELYLDAGTYLKSFYTIMLAPSCAKIGTIGKTHPRIHHAISWPHAAVQVVPERFRKARA